jgi:hypothetical protein
MDETSYAKGWLIILASGPISCGITYLIFYLLYLLGYCPHP